MAVEYSIFAALIIGLLSTVHCLGMCGGIMGALTFSLPSATRERPARLAGYLAAYNFGRIGSYAAAGALFGSVGSGIYNLLSPVGGYAVLQTAAAVLLCGIGLYLAGWFPKFAYLERAGEPLWRRLQPLGQRFLPVSTAPQALAYGAIWGWLPCGLVYSTLLLTVTIGGALEGALLMTAFGLGTLPATMGAGILSHRLGGFTRRPVVRQLAGVSLIALALAGVLFSEQLHRALPENTQSQTVQCQDDRI